MTSRAVRQVTSLIASVARKTAIQVNPIREVTVLGRNPDGSLVVDDGLGGCSRVMARANVRIGQKIMLGTEPAIGTQTNLPTQNVTIDPSQTPCPDDPRYPDGCIPSIGVPCSEAVFAAFDKSADLFAYAWSSSPEIPPFPGADGVWTDRLMVVSEADSAHGFIWLDETLACTSISSRRASDYPNTDPGDGPFADRIQFTASHLVMEFDTSSIPADARIQGVNLTIFFRGNGLGDMSGDTGGSLMIIPTGADGTDNTLNYYALDYAGDVLSTIPINDIIAFGPFPRADLHEFSFEFPLYMPGTFDPPDIYINRAGKTRFMALIDEDFLPTDFPVPATFANPGNPNLRHSIADLVRFLGARPILHVQFAGPPLT